MRCTESRCLAGIEILALFVLAEWAMCPAGSASTRPKYGGTLRVDVSAESVNLDPRGWKEGTVESGDGERIAELVYDRLVALDNYGRFQPRLATDWNHDASYQRWQFTIRRGVRFSDGSALTPAIVAAALQQLLPGGLQVSSSDKSLFVQTPSPAPDLLALLASGRLFVYRIASDGQLLGTGPFLLAGTAGGDSTGTGQTNSHIMKFQASEQCWAGRPFLDAIQITFGVPPLRALFDVQLGKADIALLTPDTVRRAEQSNLRVWKSAPLTLNAVQFDEAQKGGSDEKLREALSLSLDRATMAGVLLQKQAEPAGALLPQWLSGYAFLFTMETDLERARELRNALPAGTSGAEVPLQLQLNVPGDLAKLLGERVVVNARQAGLSMQLETRMPGFRNKEKRTPKDKASQEGTFAVLLAWRYTLLSPRWELSAMIDSLLPARSGTYQFEADREKLYDQERALLDEKEILPLVSLPDSVALSPVVRDWLPTSWGEWNLANVWLDRGANVPVNPPGGMVTGNFSGAHP